MGSGGVRTKNSLEGAFIGQNTHFTKAKLQFSPFGEGTRIALKRPIMGGYVAFFFIYACLALIYQPLRSDLFWGTIRSKVHCYA